MELALVYIIHIRAVCCLLEMTVSAAEMAEPIEVLFGLCTQ